MSEYDIINYCKTYQVNISFHFNSAGRYYITMENNHPLDRSKVSHSMKDIGELDTDKLDTIRKELNRVACCMGGGYWDPIFHCVIEP